MLRLPQPFLHQNYRGEKKKHGPLIIDYNRTALKADANKKKPEEVNTGENTKIKSFSLH